MAPLKTTKNTLISNARTTRNKIMDSLIPNKELRGKRKADASPAKETTIKRSALGDLTNNSVVAKHVNNKSKITFKPSKLKEPIVRTKKLIKNNENLVVPKAPIVVKVKGRPPIRNEVPNATVVKAKEETKENSKKIKTRLSAQFEKTQDSLYSTALEDESELIFTSAGSANSSQGQIKVEELNKRCKSIEVKSTSATKKSNVKVKTELPLKKNSSVSLVTVQLQEKLNLGNHQVPEGVVDFDKENWNDIFQSSHYAMDIFNYLKERETKTIISDYMPRQVCLTPWMRSLLVDWMVEIQESFELNHETLYLGVTLVDLYLDRMTVSKETLQLVGAAAMFVASKYDERIPPLIDDFLYICDGAYTRKSLIKMEINLLKVCDFNLGMPISYRFLRRYARCSKISMQILTLARYILETSLMDYATVTVRQSKLAAACLHLALRMKNISKWTKTLEFYTGYQIEDIKEVVIVLNNALHVKQRTQLMTIFNKYSHKIFFEVAKIPLISNEDLF